MLSFLRKDPLLDYPLLTPDEITSFITEVDAAKKGDSSSIVNSQFWHRVMAEAARRQAILARSLVFATWALVLASAVLAVATVFQLTIRHTAALALVGWYLMVPPLSADKQIDLDAPVPQWEIEESYDSAQECREAKLWHVEHPGSAAPGYGALNQRNGYAQCIATDDPRLKEK